MKYEAENVGEIAGESDVEFRWKFDREGGANNFDLPTIYAVSQEADEFDLEVSVEDEWGESINDAKVVLDRTEKEYTDIEGEVIFENLVEDEYNLLVYEPGFYPVEKTIVLNSPEEETVQLEELEFDKIEYHFIEVRSDAQQQGDATLIKTEEANILVDAGHWNCDDVVNHLDNKDINKVDYLITTHPYSDHIGEADDVIENYDVEKVFRTGYDYDSGTYDDYLNAINENNVIDKQPRADEFYALGGLLMKMVNPYEEQLGGDIHDASLSFILQYGEHRTVFTGDAEAGSESKMIERGYDLNSDIYQVGGHGSSTSISKDFLDEINPSSAVISADTNLDFPDDEVVNRLKERDIDVYLTHNKGYIDAEVSKNGTYDMGEADFELKLEIEEKNISLPSGPFSSEKRVEEFGLFDENNRMYITNTTLEPAWSLSLSVIEGDSGAWKHESKDYSYKHDGTQETGRLFVDPLGVYLESQDGCGISNLELSDSEYFQDGEVSAITIVSANENADVGCTWFMEDVFFEQEIPAAQPVGKYKIDFVFTII